MAEVTGLATGSPTTTTQATNNNSTSSGHTTNNATGTNNSTSSTVDPNAWPNQREDYELGEVIGKLIYTCLYFVCF